MRRLLLQGLLAEDAQHRVRVQLLSTEKLASHRLSMCLVNPGTVLEGCITGSGTFLELAISVPQYPPILKDSFYTQVVGG